MNDFICPKCNQPGLPSIYLPMCTACANIERCKSGEIKDDNASQQSVHLIFCTERETEVSKDDACKKCGMRNQESRPIGILPLDNL